MADSREYRTRFWAFSGVFIALLVGILVVLSFAGDRLSRYKLDFTRDGVYTLSEPFKRILENLEDKVIVTYYCSEELPSVLANHRRDTVDMLEEIRAISGQLLEYKLVDPVRAAEADARERVDKYKKAEAANEALDDLEPKPRETIQDLFRGGFGANKKTPEQIREDRRARASAIAEKTGQSVEEARYDLLRDDYKQLFLDGLMEEGIYPYPITERQGNTERTLEFYSALEIRYQNRPPETQPQYFNIASLELELAQRIVKLVTVEKPKVALFDGRAPEDQPPPDPFNPRPQGPQSDYQAVAQFLRQYFDVRTITLKEGDSIEDLESKLREEVTESRKERGEDVEEGLDEAAQISCLIVAQPHDLEPRQVYEISRAISRGIPTILLVSRHSINASGGPTSGYPIDFLNPGLDQLLDEYGITLGNGILGSNVHSTFLARVNIAALGIPTDMPYAFYCMVLATVEDELIESEHFLLNRIPALVFPATNGMTVDASKGEAKGFQVERLAWTDAETWSTSVVPFSQGQFGRGGGQSTLMNDYQKELVVDPRRRDVTSRDQTFIGRKELAVLLRGKLPFLYEGKEIPEWKKAETPPEDAVHGAPDGSGGPLGPQEGPEIPVAPAPAGDTATQPAPIEVEPGAAPTTPAPAVPAPRPKATLEPAANGQLLVLASVDGMKDLYLSFGQRARGQAPGFTSNLAFFQNAIETFGLGRELMEIRRKTITASRFVGATEGKQIFVQVVNIGLVPLVVIVVGLLRVLLRRAESARYERQMASLGK